MRCTDAAPAAGSACEVAFTDAVKAAQTGRGSRRAYARLEAKDGWPREITPDLAEFVGRLDTFFLATASAGGQPYVQHRGGPQGFLKPLGPRTLAFADYPGNRQYITVGNLSENERVMLFLLDFETRTRIKIWGRGRVVEDDPTLLAKIATPEYDATPERAIVIEVVAWDANCHQHIAARVRADECQCRIAALEARIAELEAECSARTNRGKGSLILRNQAPMLFQAPSTR